MGAARSLEEAVRLYREERVSLGKAAELAGLSVGEFLRELRARGIPLNYGPEELGEDLGIIHEMLERHPTLPRGSAAKSVREDRDSR